jgi:uncharacterized protein (DUF58 family)
VIRINKAGWLYICLTIAIGLAAVNTGNNLVYILVSALLSYMLVSGILGRRNLFNIDVDLQFPKEIFAGKTVPVGIRLINKSKLIPNFLIEAHFDSQRALFHYVEPKSSSNLYFDVKFEKRGRHSVDSVFISSIFPFNYFTRYRRIQKSFDLVILPEPKKCAWTDTHSRRDRSKGSDLSNTAGFDSDIISIRDYISGDPLRYISWKATAKTGQLKTKELSSIDRPQVLIDFDKTDKTYLEYKISCAAFIIIKLIRSNIPVGLVINGKLYKPGTSSHHKLSMLKDLALYGQG